MWHKGANVNSNVRRKCLIYVFPGPELQHSECFEAFALLWPVTHCKQSRNAFLKQTIDVKYSSHATGITKPTEIELQSSGLMRETASH